MQIDRPHTLYNFENTNAKSSKHKSIHERLNKPAKKSIDTRCIELQESANAKLSQNQGDNEQKGRAIPFEQIISPNSNYRVKI